MEFSFLSQVNKLYIPFRQKETLEDRSCEILPTNKSLQATVKNPETVTGIKNARTFSASHIPLRIYQPTSFPLVVQDMKN